jgi:Zn-finger nucleic acid-binding protein
MMVAPMPVRPSKCPLCGGSNFESGKLDGLVTFRPENRKFLTLKTGIGIHASACCDCGHLQLGVDVGELERLMPRERPDPRRGFPIHVERTGPRQGTFRHPLSPPDNADT